MSMHKFLFTFQNTHQALNAEKKTKKAKQNCRLIPTPTEIFAECGFSLEIEIDEKEYDSVTNKELFQFADCYMIAQTEPNRRFYEKVTP